MPKAIKKLDIRLPGHVRPERYRIMLHPDLEKFTFRGEETLYLNLLKPVSQIALHAKELKIDSVVFRAKGIQARPKRISLNKKTDTATFVFSAVLPRGKAELDIAFRGALNDKMRGFYRSRYHVDGRECYMATTQFEATDARRAFPCIDEPAAKAVFDVTLMTPGHCMAISNTLPVEVKEHESGYRVVRFSPTPKMSTYLLAFIVGEFEFIETKTKEGILTRVFVTPGKKHQAKFALEIAASTLSFFTRYFGIPYPLPVMDLIAIPDFAAGAMENWGAVTYRESALLFDEEHSSAANKQWVALVIAHELAHQWFGNLVTMEWWTHLWLNEGFASYIEYLAVDHLFPEWDIWTQFVHQDLAPALHLDALKNTHPIEVPVYHPDEIGEIFDAISYQKGSSIIRMLADYLGERDFRAGLTRYLKKHQYANARTEDLWAAFERASGKPVRKIMRNWTARGGYPVITVSQKERGFVLRQSRFFSSPLSKRMARDTTIWSVPIAAKRLQSSVSKLLLDKKLESLNISLKKNDWLKLNCGVSGVYRVDYPAELLHRLAHGVKKKELEPRDRFNVQNDAFALCEAGLLKTHEALALAEFYKDETDYTVWADLSSNIGRLDALFWGLPFHKEYREFSRAVFSRIAASMGWKKKPGEKHTDSLLRSLALFNYGSYGDEKTVASARRLFESGFRKPRNSIPPDLRGVVYGLAAESGGEKDYERLISRYVVETMHEEKNRIGRALGRFRQKELIKRTLELSLSKDVRPQDASIVMGGAWGNSRGRELAWEFVKKNWQVLVDRYGEGGHTLPRFIQPAGGFATLDKAKDFESFFKKNAAPGAERAVEQAVEFIRSNAEWLKRDAADVAKWLKSRK